MRAIIAWRPTAIITYHAYPAPEENPATSGLVHSYIRARGHTQAPRRLPEACKWAQWGLSGGRRTP